MRTIKFRGKRIDNGEWAYGLFVANFDNNYSIQVRHDFEGMEYFTSYYVNTETVGQFTGLTDKNGVDIYEGDVFGNENIPSRFVVFEDGKFCFNMVHSQGADSLSQDRIGRIEVIGNIHDNPTLIK